MPVPHFILPIPAYSSFGVTETDGVACVRLRDPRGFVPPGYREGPDHTFFVPVDELRANAQCLIVRSPVAASLVPDSKLG